LRLSMLRHSLHMSVCAYKQRSTSVGVLISVMELHCSQHRNRLSYIKRLVGCFCFLVCTCSESGYNCVRRHSALLQWFLITRAEHAIGSYTKRAQTTASCALPPRNHSAWCFSEELWEGRLCTRPTCLWPTRGSNSMMRALRLLWKVQDSAAAVA
jgi:hypothetical protein